MDIDFSVQDTFALTRPQWKLASNLEEATKAFQLAVVQDQKTAGVDKAAVDADDGTSDSSSDDDIGDGFDIEHDGDIEGDGEEDSASEEDESEEVEYASDAGSGFDDESIVVTRQQEAVDPEDEAEFEREYAKMMAESLESRKFERKQLFDVPLPLRAKGRDPLVLTSTGDMPEEPSAPPETRTMAFSLLTKRGNRQQVCCLTIVKLNITDTHSPYRPRQSSCPLTLHLRLL